MSLQSPGVGDLLERAQHHPALPRYRSGRVPGVTLIYAGFDVATWSAVVTVAAGRLDLDVAFGAAVLGALQGVCGFLVGLYRRTWTIGVSVVVRRVVLTVCPVGILFGLAFPLAELGVSRSAVALAAVIALAGQLGARLVGRRLRGEARRMRRVVVIGASSLAGQWLHALRVATRPGFVPLAVLDDDITKLSTRLVGVPVQGPVEYLAVVAQRYRADSVLIACGGHDGVDDEAIDRLRASALALGLEVLVISDHFPMEPPASVGRHADQHTTRPVGAERPASWSSPTLGETPAQPWGPAAGLPAPAGASEL